MNNKPVRPYIKGRRFEYKVMSFFEKLGFYVIRSAGSKGDFDIIAIRDGKTYGIQATMKNTLPPERLRVLAMELKITTVFVCRVTNNKGRIYFFKPDGSESVHEAVLKG